MEEGQLAQDPFPMKWILRKLQLSTFGKDQKGGYLKTISPVFENLEDEVCLLLDFFFLINDQISLSSKINNILQPNPPS